MTVVNWQETGLKTP